jgi:hypothetical protein
MLACERLSVNPALTLNSIPDCHNVDSVARRIFVCAFTISGLLARDRHTHVFSTLDEARAFAIVQRDQWHNAHT